METKKRNTKETQRAVEATMEWLEKLANAERFGAGVVEELVQTQIGDVISTLSVAM